MRTKKLKCFTLIEVLTVVAIIGILAATILVALNSARNKSKDARIESEMNQVRAISAAHYSDYHAYFASNRPYLLDASGNSTGLPDTAFDCNVDPASVFIPDFGNPNFKTFAESGATGSTIDMYQRCKSSWGVTWPTSYQISLYKILSDVGTQGGSAFRGTMTDSMGSIGNTYVYWSTLSSDKNKSYCVDSVGNNKVVTTVSMHKQSGQYAQYGSYSCDNYNPAP